MKTNIYITKDGHKVRSRAEVIIDNLLNDLNVSHEYEEKLRIGKVELKPDWYLKNKNSLIEFWGMEDREEYTKKQIFKLKLYAEHNIPCLSLNDDDLANNQVLEDKIVDFVNRNSSGTQEKLKKENKKKIKPDSQIIYQMKQGNKCYFCLSNKPSNRKKPLCRDCYEKLKLKTICSYCGELFDEVIDDPDKFTAFMCDSCYGDTYDSCKICYKPIEIPTKGKPLCYICYSVISQANPSMPTPKWIKKRNRT